MTSPSDATSAPWIFGYGSLIWRPAIPFVEQRVCRLAGWRRVFWQGSPDHRGTPEAPGRVVTLVPDPQAVCWGRAFRISPDAVDETLEALDVREQGGYERHVVDLEVVAGGAETSPSPGSLAALLWIASHENDHHLGPASVDEMARQVVASHGPSGSNVEYVLRLHEALLEIGGHDPHVTELADEVRRRLRSSPTDWPVGVS